MASLDQVRVEFDPVNLPFGRDGEWTDWVDITAAVHTINIRRGRDGALDDFEAGTCRVVVSNDDRRFDPQNRTSPFWQTWLTLPGASGAYARTGDVASITGDLDIQVHCAATDWTPSAEQTLVAKWQTTGNQRSYRLALDTTGRLVGQWSPNGSTVVTATATNAVAVADGTPMLLRWTLDVNVGGGWEAKFWRSNDNGASWLQIGSTVTGTPTTSIFDSTANLAVGAHNDGTGGPFNGVFYRARVLDGIGGTVRSDISFRWGWGAGGSTATDRQGHVWTRFGAATLTDGQQTWLLPRRRLQVTCPDSSSTRQYLFAGHVRIRDGWQISYDMPTRSEVTIFAVDAFQFLAAAHLPEIDPPDHEELSGFRVLRVLDAVIGTANGPRNLADGVTVLANSKFGVNALAHLQNVAFSEGGAFFIGADGAFTFEDRHAVILDVAKTTPQAVFSDDGTDVPYMQDGFERGFMLPIVNEARYGRAEIDDGQSLQEWQDVLSVVAYGRLSDVRPDLLMRDAPEAFARAQWVVHQFRNPQSAPTQIVLHPIRSNTVGDQALQRRLRDRITVKFRPPGSGTPTQQVKDCLIMRIEHHLDARRRDWTTTFGLEPADRFGFAAYGNYLILDNSLSGRLDVQRVAF